MKKEAFGSLFGDGEDMTTVQIAIENLPEFEPIRILELEKETMGFYVSGHPLDGFRSDIEAVPHTLSSDIENVDSGSALFIGKVEGITEKISKKGNKFGLVNLMDFHGNMEFMIFQKTLEKLQGMDLDSPVCFVVEITRNEQGTRLLGKKVINLKDAKKEKVETKIVEEPLAPTKIRIELTENYDAIEQLYALVRANHGRSEVELVITSKLVDVKMNTYIKIDPSITSQIEAIEGIEVIG
jgi:DNA polymerase-3 subunit alpha